MSYKDFEDLNNPFPPPSCDRWKDQPELWDESRAEDEENEEEEQ